MEVFRTVITNEDYYAAELQQHSVENGQPYLIYGRNEPALHHYHNTFRTVLGMPPLEAYTGQG